MDDSLTQAFRHLVAEELVGIILGGAFANEREKSSAAEGRERTARKKFDYLRTQMVMAFFENAKVTVGLGRHPKSRSPLNLLSPDLMEHIWGFVGMEKPAAATVRARSGLAIVPFEGWRPESRTQQTKEIDLSDTSLYKPGQKIVIPLATPEFHMTAPCYRDLRKHIKAQAGWDVQRIAATPQEKRSHNEHQRGKVYFINVIYKVPGRPLTRKRQRKTAATSFRHLPSQQAGAKAVLDAAVQSARIDGQIDPACLRFAEEAGYSRHFVLGKVAEYWDVVKDATPRSKKAKT